MLRKTRIADTKTGCKVWNPAPAQDESIKWSGKCKDGKADGKVSLEWYKNSELQTTITGTMKVGQCAQDCSVRTKDGDSYVGEMKDNLPMEKVFSSALTANMRASSKTASGAAKAL